MTLINGMTRSSSKKLAYAVMNILRLDAEVSTAEINSYNIFILYICNQSISLIKLYYLALQCHQIQSRDI